MSKWKSWVELVVGLVASFLVSNLLFSSLKTHDWLFVILGVMALLFYLSMIAKAWKNL